MLVGMIATNTYSRPPSVPRMAMMLGWLVLGLGWVTAFALATSVRRWVTQAFSAPHPLVGRVEPHLFPQG